MASTARFSLFPGQVFVIKFFYFLFTFFSFKNTKFVVLNVHKERTPFFFFYIILEYVSIRKLKESLKINTKIIFQFEVMTKLIDARGVHTYFLALLIR